MVSTARAPRTWAPAGTRGEHGARTTHLGPSRHARRELSRTWDPICLAGLGGRAVLAQRCQGAQKHARTWGPCACRASGTTEAHARAGETGRAACAHAWGGGSGAAAAWRANGLLAVRRMSCRSLCSSHCAEGPSAAHTVTPLLGQTARPDPKTTCGSLQPTQPCAPLDTLCVQAVNRACAVRARMDAHTHHVPATQPCCCAGNPKGAVCNVGSEKLGLERPAPHAPAGHLCRARQAPCLRC